MENNIVELQSNNNNLYRELGNIEGRVSALESSSKEIKNMLNTMMAQLTSIQNTVATFIGRRDASESTKDKAWSYIERVITIIIAAVSTYLIVKYGR